jgi:DNA repair protein RadC
VVKYWDVEPLTDDLSLTKRLIKVGKILGVEVVDHIIVSNLNIFSFKDKKLF